MRATVVYRIGCWNRYRPSAGSNRCMRPHRGRLLLPTSRERHRFRRAQPPRVRRRPLRRPTLPAVNNPRWSSPGRRCARRTSSSDAEPAFRSTSATFTSDTSSPSASSGIVTRPITKSRTTLPGRCSIWFRAETFGRSVPTAVVWSGATWSRAGIRPADSCGVPRRPRPVVPQRPRRTRPRRVVTTTIPCGSKLRISGPRKSASRPFDSISGMPSARER
mmetsp:Transcript_30232/g.88411  ORF Transcript_30232/g.88411 Transcript_30232/m.88411 type:complete len:219 (+) Transcript_30232:454-1110(+)